MIQGTYCLSWREKGSIILRQFDAMGMQLYMGNLKKTWFTFMHNDETQTWQTIEWAIGSSSMHIYVNMDYV